MLSLYFHQLMGRIEKNEAKKYLMTDDYMCNRVLGKIKTIISIEKLDD